MSLLGIIPLEQLFNFGGEQIALHVGPQLGELINIAMNKFVHQLVSDLKHKLMFRIIAALKLL